MSEKIRLYEILSVMYVMIGKPLPRELETVTEYTSDVEAVLRKDGWIAHEDFQNNGQRCVGFFTKKNAQSFTIQNQPDSSVWQGSCAFFEPWPGGWTDAHKIGFLSAYSMNIPVTKLALFPAMPMCIMHVFDDEIIILRFFFGQINGSMRSVKLMFDLVEHFGIEFIDSDRQSDLIQLYTYIFVNSFIAFKNLERKQNVDN